MFYKATISLVFFIYAQNTLSFDYNDCIDPFMPVGDLTTWVQDVEETIKVINQGSALKIEGGPTISGSCKGFQDDIVKSYIETLKSVNICSEIYGFSEIEDFKRILPEVTIECSTQSEDVAEAEAILLVKDPEQGWLERFLHGAREVKVAAGSKFGKKIQPRVINLNTNKESKNFFFQRDEYGLHTSQRPSIIFHEILHLSGANSHFRSHSNPEAFEYNYDSPKSSTCNRSPVINDRVYFLQAACFPGTAEGGGLYSRAIHRCEAQCVQNLMTLPSESMFWEDEIISGKALIAPSYNQKKSTEICEKIKKYGDMYFDFYPNLGQYLEKMEYRWSAPETQGQKEIYSAFQKIQKKFKNSEYMNSFEIEEDYKKIMSLKNNACRKENSFCESAEYYLQKMEFYLKRYNRDLYRLFRDKV